VVSGMRGRSVAETCCGPAPAGTGLASVRCPYATFGPYSNHQVAPVAPFTSMLPLATAPEPTRSTASVATPTGAAGVVNAWIRLLSSVSPGALPPSSRKVYLVPGVRPVSAALTGPVGPT